jgi:hypothetical protein
LCGICGINTIREHVTPESAAAAKAPKSTINKNEEHQWRAAFIKPTKDGGEAVLWNLVPTCGCNQDSSCHGEHLMTYMINNNRSHAIEHLFQIKWYQLQMEGYIFDSDIPHELMAIMYVGDGDGETKLKDMFKGMSFIFKHHHHHDGVIVTNHPPPSSTAASVPTTTSSTSVSSAPTTTRLTMQSIKARVSSTGTNTMAVSSDMSDDDECMDDHDDTQPTTANTTWIKWDKVIPFL